SGDVDALLAALGAVALALALAVLAVETRRAALRTALARRRAPGKRLVGDQEARQQCRRRDARETLQRAAARDLTAGQVAGERVQIPAGAHPATLSPPCPRVKSEEVVPVPFKCPSSGIRPGSLRSEPQASRV